MNLIVVKKVLKSKNYKMLVWVFFMLIVFDHSAQTVPLVSLK